MTEILQSLQALVQLPSAIHWFCDAVSAADNSPDLRLVNDLRFRQDEAAECLLLYTYSDAKHYQETLTSALDAQLARCDKCIEQYYKARIRHDERLRNDYADDEVDEVKRVIDGQDFDRINRELDKVKEILQELEPAKRSKNALEVPSQLALFEALCNEQYLLDKSNLAQHFDAPFTLVQTNKKLVIANYTPAATAFLFDPDIGRHEWARHIWLRCRSSPSKEDFNYAIKGFLRRQLEQAHNMVLDRDMLQRFWEGMDLIVQNLNTELVSHSLRALEVDVFKLALDHLRFPLPSLRPLIETIQRLLEISPRDFWDSMGTISPTTYVEQIFNNAQYDRFLEAAVPGDRESSSALTDMLSWIKPFVSSLELAHQAGVCRSISFQLLQRLQSERFPECARLECYETGMAALGRILEGLVQDTSLNPTTQIVAKDVLDVIGEYMLDFAKIKSQPDSSRGASCGELSLRIVQNSLALECKSLRIDQESLEKLSNGQELPAGFAAYVSSVWDGVVQNVRPNNVSLAKAAVTGIADLARFEKLKPASEDVLAKARVDFNGKLDFLRNRYRRLLDLINDFSSEDLKLLYQSSQSAQALIAPLFVADANLFDAAVVLLKRASGESIRREAVGQLLHSCPGPSLDAIAQRLRQIAEDRIYPPCPRMFKTCSDIIDSLCDVDSGLLRTTSALSPAQSNGIQKFWQQQWEVLGMIYERTETWGREKADDHNAMKEFCRDTMQFSDRLIDQYSVFASGCSLSENFQSASNANIPTMDLLRGPATTLYLIVKWLRLRDVVLVGIAVKLTKKIMTRLTEHSQQVDRRTSNMLELIIVSGPSGRSHLTPQEKAELLLVLESNTGRRISQPGDSDALSRSEDSRASTPQPSQSSKRAKAGSIDLDAWRARARNQPAKSSGDFLEQEAGISADLIRKFKDQQATLSTGERPPTSQQKISEAKKAAKATAGPAKILPSEAQQASFIERRKKEQEAQKRRNAESAAMIKRKGVVGPQISGQGSALKGLGIAGKDHAPQGPSIMFSSDSESEEEDETDNDIIGISKAKTASELAPRAEANKVRPSNMPVKKRKQIRSAKDMRARLIPDLTQLHRTLLSWEYFHDADFPPNSNQQDYQLVAKTFKTPLEYQSTFEPLLLLEAWQQLLQSRDENNHKAFEVKITSRMNVDSFLEVSTTLASNEAAEIGIGEADVMLLSKVQNPSKDRQEPHCLARVWRISRKKGNVQVTYRANANTALTSSMLPNSALHCSKVFSITPLEREYGALRGLQYFDLCDEIVRARPSPLLGYSEQQLESLQKNYQINQAQAKAVKSAIDNDAFTLIQGPPGSGKTKTIVAIVGALLTESLGAQMQARSIQKPGAPATKSSGGSPSKKLLVCAPSNAAVDELVMRFKRGVKTRLGEDRSVSVVRLGRSDAINANVMDVTLEELVNAKLNVNGAKTPKPGEEIGALMTAHKSSCEEVKNLRATFDALKASGQEVSPQQSRDFELLKRKLDQLSKQIDSARDNGDMYARNAEINRRQMQQDVLDGANVICATLSGSGHDMFQNLNIEFETVVIDEAAQCIELSALIPLKYGCAKCILVGDPKQLPPTVLSREAAKFQYEQSLFVRMQENHPESVNLLDTQYRMHPEISQFPSQAFYDGRLLDGAHMARQRTRPWHQSTLLSPYRFFDVQGLHQSAPRGHSLINLAEVDFALKLYLRLITDCSNYDFHGKVGIITPYKSQLRELRSRFARRFGDDILTNVEFNTTDAFQGRESEVIIFSCVRASTSRGIGFLSDIRRMNVGITRAKSSLWVLGNSDSLMQGEYWGRLIEDAKHRNLYTTDTSGKLLQKAQLLPPVAPVSLPQTPLPTESLAPDHEDTEMPDAPASALSKTSLPTDSGVTRSNLAINGGQQVHATQNTNGRTEIVDSEYEQVDNSTTLNRQRDRSDNTKGEDAKKRRRESTSSLSEHKALKVADPGKGAAAISQLPNANDLVSKSFKKPDGLLADDYRGDTYARTPANSLLNRSTNQMANVKPPRVKKKEVDPFIRRKK